MVDKAFGSQTNYKITRDNKLRLFDHSLWNKVIETVKPLDKKDISAQQTDQKMLKAKKDKQNKGKTLLPHDQSPRKPISLTSLSELKQKKPAVQNSELRHGASAGHDRRNAERLRRGKLAIDGRLDLHGLTRQSAHQSLNSFIIGSHRAGFRCVLVVTGKGKGILQGDVPVWLNQTGLREKLLSFTYAQPKDGGTGALYILLKRKR